MEWPREVGGKMTIKSVVYSMIVLLSFVIIIRLGMTILSIADGISFSNFKIIQGGLEELK